MEKEFTIRKKIAKHGENSIIVIPKLLREELKPSTIVEINIKVLEGAEENEKLNN
jgi:hypothetical protein